MKFLLKSFFSFPFDYLLSIISLISILCLILLYYYFFWNFNSNHQGICLFVFCAHVCGYLCMCACVCRYIKTHTNIFSPIKILLYLLREHQVEQKWVPILALGFKISRWVQKYSLNSEVNSVTWRSIREIYFSQLFPFKFLKIRFLGFCFKMDRTLSENMDKNEIFYKL